MEAVVSADFEIRYVVLANRAPKRCWVYLQKVSDLIDRHDRRVHAIRYWEVGRMALTVSRRSYRILN